MQVRCDEGVATHIGPEPCVGTREGVGEASAGECIGQPLSREMKVVPGADALRIAEGNTGRRARASTCLTPRGLRPWHARKLFAREPGYLSSGQLPHWAGPCREGEEP